VTAESRSCILPHDIAVCPHCGRPHRFMLEVRPNAAEDKAELLFGGGFGGRITAVAFTCPCTGRPLRVEVADPLDGVVVGPADAAVLAAGVPGPPIVAGADQAARASGPAEAEFTEWIKASRATAVEFCKSLITASVGAIPIYFAVLKYLGYEVLDPSQVARFGALPPFLFLLAAVIFALELLPRFAQVTRADFATFRAIRLRRLNRLMLGGLAIFGVAVAASILIGLAILRQEPKASTARPAAVEGGAIIPMTPPSSR
jgi:hypothetical protein